jgi:ATP-dependent Clp protease ATP-binding subunit ClpA
LFERFSGSAREVMALADAEADRLHHDYVGPEHVLAGLAAQAGGGAAATLRAAGLGAAAVRAGLDLSCPAFSGQGRKFDTTQNSDDFAHRSSSDSRNASTLPPSASPRSLIPRCSKNTR